MPALYAVPALARAREKKKGGEKKRREGRGSDMRLPIFRAGGRKGGKRGERRMASTKPPTRLQWVRYGCRDGGGGLGGGESQLYLPGLAERGGEKKKGRGCRELFLLSQRPTPSFGWEGREEQE